MCIPINTMYSFLHMCECAHTNLHAHTHIYIYIYIYTVVDAAENTSRVLALNCQLRRVARWDGDPFGQPGALGALWPKFQNEQPSTTFIIFEGWACPGRSPVLEDVGSNMWFLGLSWLNKREKTQDGPKLDTKNRRRRRRIPPLKETFTSTLTLTLCWWLRVAVSVAVLSLAFFFSMFSFSPVAFAVCSLETWKLRLVTEPLCSMELVDNSKMHL